MPTAENLYRMFEIAGDSIFLEYLQNNKWQTNNQHSV